MLVSAPWFLQLQKLGRSWVSLDLSLSWAHLMISPAGGFMAVRIPRWPSRGMERRGKAGREAP
jgi:hypothetical protein